MGMEKTKEAKKKKEGKIRMMGKTKIEEKSPQ